MGEHFDRLRERLGEITNLNKAAQLLSWDQKTYMPRGGARARAEQMATLARFSHNLFTSDETGELIAAAAEEVGDRPYDSFEASLVRVAQRDYDKARRVPPWLVAEIRRHAGMANPIWVEARKNDDFASFAPCLQRSVELSREVAEHLGYEDEIYDPLLDQFEPGMKAAQVRQIFGDLKAELVPLVAAIAERTDRVDDSCLHQPYDEAKQEEFSLLLVQRFGYDLDRGRMDRTVHPFATSFSRGDCRITTRYIPNWLAGSIFPTMHEAGHAMYEQGTGEELEGTPLARGGSLGLHESQSRLWENVVGRSRRLWEHFYPQLQATFPEELGSVTLDTFYGAINKVQPSFIRVEADEVTYNLHIMLRFEMEIDLVEGRISVQEAPDVWNAKMEEYLGIRPPTDTEGILQDTHWSGGQMGYFPTYSLGNIISVQLYDKAVSERPEIPEDIGRGEFGSLHGWLTEHLYRYGRMFEPAELLERATGRQITIGPYVGYLKGKFGELYGL